MRNVSFFRGNPTECFPLHGTSFYHMPNRATKGTVKTRPYYPCKERSRVPTNAHSVVQRPYAAAQSSDRFRPKSDACNCRKCSL